MRTSLVTKVTSATRQSATTPPTVVKEPKRDNFNKSVYKNNINFKNQYNTSYQLNTELPDTKLSKLANNNNNKEDTEQYTYEGAIQNYRSRIKSKINIDESIFNKSQEYNRNKEVNEAQNLLPKGNLFKRKEMFEVDKVSEQLDTSASRKLSEEFANTQSIKDRLKSLVQYTEQPLKTTDKYDVPVKSVKERLQNFNRQNDCDNNNYRPLRESVSHSNINKISNYLLDKSNSHSSLDTKNNTKNDWMIKDETYDRSSSPEAEIYMNKLNMFNRDLDTIMHGKSIRNNIDNDMDYMRHPNYMSSASSNDIVAGSSDREDSGIHTADVSCSVSQADEQLDDNELNSNTIPKCIEMLQINGDDTINDRTSSKNEHDVKKKFEIDEHYDDHMRDEIESIPSENLESFINSVREFINAERQHTDVNAIVVQQKSPEPPATITDDDRIDNSGYPQSAIYENVEIKQFPPEFITNDLFGNPALSLAPPKHILPPKEKPPPPPPATDTERPDVNLKRLNSAKRIKKEIQIKRSSFLGLDDPIDDQLDPEAIIDKPPDIKSFLQRESNLEKTLYKKLQGTRDAGLSEVESQDSGLDIERGRLSSDTWCSSLIDSNTSVHNRQDSGVTM